MTLSGIAGLGANPFTSLAPPLLTGSFLQPAGTPSVFQFGNQATISPWTVTGLSLTAGTLITIAVFVPFPSLTGAIGLPSGFTVVFNGGNLSTGFKALCYKRAGPSEPTSFTVTWSGGSGDWIHGIFGIATNPSIVDGIPPTNSGLSLVMTAPSATPRTATDLLLCWFFSHTGDTITTAPTGMTVITGGGNGTIGTLYLFGQTLSSRGATGTRSCQTTSGLVNSWTTFTELLRQ